VSKYIVGMFEDQVTGAEHWMLIALRAVFTIVPGMVVVWFIGSSDFSGVTGRR
jgi:hypothetical protein